MTKYRATSSHNESSNYFEEDEEEEELQKRLEDYEAMLRRAEYLRQLKLDENIERVH